MPTTYRATLTNVGAALVADAIASGTTLTWAKMALGDGNGSAVVVDASRTSLVNERYRAPLNDLGRDSANPNTIVGTLVVPPETGGWTIREFGIYDNASTPRLVAYGETPEIEKPASAAGTGINLRLRFKLVVSADANITLSPDSNEAYATIEYVKDNAVKSLSVSGRTITYTMGDGDTHTIQTQDTTYSDATQSVHGLMSVNDKKKLDGIEAQAEVNQNAFSNVKVGNVTVAADSKTDTLELVAGTGITLTPDATNDKVTAKVTDNTYLPLAGGTMYGEISSSAYYTLRRNTNDSQLTLLGGDHGDAVYGAKLLLNGADYQDSGWFTLQAGNANNHVQLVGKPDGTLMWNNTSLVHNNATISKSGLMSATDKLALDNVPSTYLKLSGGTMTGGIISQASYSLYRPTNDSQLTLLGSSSGDSSKGAKILLSGCDYVESGQFKIQAGNSTGYKQLIGKPDGELLWNGYQLSPIAKSASGIGQWQRLFKNGSSISLPSGGTWAYFVIGVNSNKDLISIQANVAAGGTIIINDTGVTRIYGFCWRIA